MAGNTGTGSWILQQTESSRHSSQEAKRGRTRISISLLGTSPVTLLSSSGLYSQGSHYLPIAVQAGTSLQCMGLWGQCKILILTLVIITKAQVLFMECLYLRRGMRVTLSTLTQPFRDIEHCSQLLSFQVFKHSLKKFGGLNYRTGRLTYVFPQTLKQGKTVINICLQGFPILNFPAGSVGWVSEAL